MTKDVSLIKILKLLKTVKNYLVDDVKNEKYDFFRYI